MLTQYRICSKILTGFKSFKAHKSKFCLAQIPARSLSLILGNPRPAFCYGQYNTGLRKADEKDMVRTDIRKNEKAPKSLRPNQNYTH